MRQLLCLWIGLLLLSTPLQADITISSYPTSVAMTSGNLANMSFLTAGGQANLSTGTAWNGGNAVRLFGPTGGQAYAALGQFPLSGSPTRINIRFVARWGSAYFSDDTACCPKHVIVLRSTGDDSHRYIVQQHAYDAGPQVDIGLGNSVDPTYAPCPGTSGLSCLDGNSPGGGFNYANYVGDYVSFEFESTVGGVMRAYITKQVGTTDASVWNERSLFAGQSETDVTVIGSGSWDTIQIIGAFGGPFTQGSGNANAWFEISDLTISNTYIGPPAGFRGGSPKVKGKMRLRGLYLLPLVLIGPAFRVRRLRTV